MAPGAVGDEEGVGGAGDGDLAAVVGAVVIGADQDQVADKFPSYPLVAASSTWLSRRARPPSEQHRAGTAGLSYKVRLARFKVLRCTSRNHRCDV